MLTRLFFILNNPTKRNEIHILSFVEEIHPTLSLARLPGLSLRLFLQGQVLQWK